MDWAALSAEYAEKAKQALIDSFTEAQADPGRAAMKALRGFLRGGINLAEMPIRPPDAGIIPESMKPASIKQAYDERVGAGDSLFDTLGEMAFPGPKFKKAPATRSEVLMGKEAPGANLEKLDEAQWMKGKGDSSGKIWRRTGWEEEGKVPDKWQWEVPDQEAKLLAPSDDSLKDFLGMSTYNGDLKNFIKHDKLFAEAPQMGDIQLKGMVNKFAPGPSGRFSANYMVAEAPTEAELLSVILHEITHGTQRQFGFSGGTDSEWISKAIANLAKSRRLGKIDPDFRDAIAHRLYESAHGEALARAVQRRAGQTAEQNLLIPPSDSIIAPRGKTYSIQEIQKMVQDPVYWRR